jgi:riboflavin synthase
MSGKLGMFISGAFFASGVGYYQIYKDFKTTTSLLEQNIKETKEIIVEKNLLLEEKISTNEKNLELLLEHTQEMEGELFKLMKEPNQLKKYAKQLSE